MAVGKRSQTDVGSEPLAENRRAILCTPIFAATRAGMVAMRVGDQIHVGLPPGVDVKGVVGADESAGLQPDQIRHAPVLGVQRMAHDTKVFTAGS